MKLRILNCLIFSITVVIHIFIINPALAQQFEFIESGFDATINENDYLLNNKNTFALNFPGESCPSFFQFDTNQLKLIRNIDDNIDNITWIESTDFFDGILELLASIENTQHIYFIPQINGNFFELSITYSAGLNYPERANSIFVRKDLAENGQWQIFEESEYYVEYESENGFFPYAAIFMDLNNDSNSDWLMINYDGIKVQKVYASETGWEHGDIVTFNASPENVSYRLKHLNIYRDEDGYNLVGGFNEIIHGEFAAQKGSSAVFQIEDILSNNPQYFALSGDTQGTGVISKVNDDVLMVDYGSISRVDIIENGTGLALQRESMFAGPFNLAGTFWNEEENLVEELFVYDQFSSKITNIRGVEESHIFKIPQRWRYSPEDEKYHYVESFYIPSYGNCNITAFSTKLPGVNGIENALIFYINILSGFSRDTFLRTYRFNENNDIYLDSTLNREGNQNWAMFIGCGYNQQDIISLEASFMYDDYSHHTASENWTGVSYEVNSEKYLHRAAQGGAIADWDGNGTPDLLSGNRFYRNNNQRNFPLRDYEEFVFDELPGNAVNWTILDYQNDGLPDILTGDGRLFINNPIAISLETEDTHISDFEIINLYPNPFNNKLNIVYELQNPQLIEINLFNLLGQKVLSVENGHQSAGLHTKILSTTDISSGTYYLQSKIRNRTSNRKVILLK